MGPAGDDAAGDGELNIIPYLDIIMNLVIFLIFSFQVLDEVTQIEVPAPAYSTAGGGGAADEKNSLSVFIHSQGYDIIPMSSKGEGLSGKESVPLKNGKYDTDGLTAALERLAHSFPFGPAMVITADRKIPYKVIVDSMDAARKDSKGKDLFPQVALAEAAAAGG